VAELDYARTEADCTLGGPVRASRVGDHDVDGVPPVVGS